MLSHAMHHCNSNHCHNQVAVHQICHHHRHQHASLVHCNFTTFSHFLSINWTHTHKFTYLSICFVGQPAGNAPDLSLSFGKGGNRHTSAPASPAKSRESLLQRVQSLTGAARDQGASFIGKYIILGLFINIIRFQFQFTVRLNGGTCMFITVKFK